MPQTVVHRYKSERALQHGVTRMGAGGWRVVSQSSYTPKKGFIRWILGGFIFFNRRPEHLVTFEAADGVAPVLVAETAVATLTPTERTALTQQWQERWTAHQAQLSPVAQLLHQRPVAIASLVVFNALWLVGAVMSWQALIDVALVLGIALAVVDWTGVRSLGGRVNWALYRHEHPKLSIWAIIGLVLFFMVPVDYYLVGCLSPTAQPALTTHPRVE